MCVVPQGDAWRERIPLDRMAAHRRAKYLRATDVGAHAALSSGVLLPWMNFRDVLARKRLCVPQRDSEFEHWRFVSVELESLRQYGDPHEQWWSARGVGGGGVCFSDWSGLQPERRSSEQSGTRLRRRWRRWRCTGWRHGSLQHRVDRQ
jgi:hypothetical protein